MLNQQSIHHQYLSMLLAVLLVALSASTGLAAHLSDRSDLPPVISAPSGWKRTAEAIDDDHVLRMEIALSFDGDSYTAAAKALEQVSDPSSPTFGQHWTREETTKHFSPPRSHVREVARWLNNSGVPRDTMRLSADGARLSFRTTAGNARTVFQSDFYRHRRRGAAGAAILPDRYSVPKHVARYIDYILPSHEPEPVARRNLAARPIARHPLAARAGRPIDCFKYMSPDCLRHLYNIKTLPSKTPHPNNSLGVFTPSWGTYLPDDMDMFFRDFAPDLVGQRPLLMPINGGYQQHEYKLTPFNLEANLDYQYTMSLIHPIAVTDIQVGDYTQVGNLNTMLSAFDTAYCTTALNSSFDPIWPNHTPHPSNYNATDCGRYTPPRVITIQSVQNEAHFPRSYLRRQCLEFLKLGLQGVTVLAASGDRGTADQLGGCIDPRTGNVTGGISPSSLPTKNATFSQGEVHFASTWPASCPWVTAVGATELIPPSQNETWSPGKEFPRETALSTNSTQSSGGFSRAFGAPWYQTLRGDTRSYLADTKVNGTVSLRALAETGGLFDARGRGYPDVSAVGKDFLIGLYGKYHVVRGTSASTPVVAAMVALVNEERLKAGKGTVGFINPVLYKYREKFVREVEVGAVGGCGFGSVFPARKGWDAVTGLGTLDFERLKEVYLRLP